MTTKWIPGARSTYAARRVWLRETQLQLPPLPALYIARQKVPKNAVPKTWDLEVIDGRRYSTGVGPSAFYSTTFDGTEDPLSEGGVWLNAGGAVAQYWQNMRKAGGVAFGAGPTDEYEDCVAIIDPAVIPFAADQVIRARVHITGGYTAPDFTHECQLLLRGNFGNNFISGYEVLLQLGAGTPVVMKWTGAGGGGFFAQLPEVSSAFIGFQHDDIIIAQVSGSSPALIEVYRDRGGTVSFWFSASDNGTVLSGAPIITSGQPGAVQFTRDDPDMVENAFAWSSFQASDDAGDFE